MQRTRRRLSWLAAGWVLCQIAGFAAAPIVLSAENLADANTAALCTCADATPGTACPMHRGHSDDPTRSGTDGQLRNSCAPSDAALLSLAGAIGLVPSQAAVDVDHVAALIPGSFISAVNRVERPEFPPPRS